LCGLPLRQLPAAPRSLAHDVHFLRFAFPVVVSQA
jgi:hypothetical protein